MAVIKVSGGSGKTFNINGGTIAPNGHINGSPGDWYLRDNGGAGEAWQKTSGYNTKTGWTQLVAGVVSQGTYANQGVAAAAGVTAGQWFITTATQALTLKT